MIDHSKEDDLIALGFTKKEIQTITEKLFINMPETVKKDSELVEYAIVKLKELEFDEKYSKPHRFEILLFLIGMTYGITTQITKQQQDLFSNLEKFFKDDNK